MDKIFIYIISFSVLLMVQVTEVYPCDTLKTIRLIEIKLFSGQSEKSPQPELQFVKIKYGTSITCAVFDKTQEVWIAKRPFPVNGKIISILDTSKYTFTQLSDALFECRDDLGVLYCEFEFSRKEAECKIEINSMPKKCMVKCPIFQQEKTTDFKASIKDETKPVIFEVEAGNWGGKKFYCPVELTNTDECISLDINRIKEKVMQSEFCNSIPAKNRIFIVGQIKLEKVTVRKECSQ